MIDNILDLIKAATSSQSIDMEAVVATCHPLGMLEPSVMKSILAYEDLGEDFHSLYRTVLVDTPVGKYFTQFLEEIAAEKSAGDIDHVRATFAEVSTHLNACCCGHMCVWMCRHSLTPPQFANVR